MIDDALPPACNNLQPAIVNRKTQWPGLTKKANRQEEKKQTTTEETVPLTTRGSVNPGADRFLMGFEISQITAGFDASRVLSDEKHYSSFICSICTNLVSLDAVVTSRCSHPFCRRCLESWALQCNLRQVACSCPMCKEDLSSNESSLDTMEFGTVQVSARPLQEVQPLAFRVLSLVQVSCCDDSGKRCEWSGDYGKYLQHASCHSDSDKVLVKSPGVQVRENQTTSMAKSIVGSVEKGGHDGENESETDPASGGENEGDLDEDNDEDVDNPASPRWKTNTSISSTPVEAKARLVSIRDGPPVRVTRKKSNSPGQPQREEKEQDDDDSQSQSSSEDESYVRGKNLKDWNMSINSMAHWNESDHDKADEVPVKEVEETEQDAIQIEPEDDGSEITNPTIKAQQILERTEKLKKQANAKFNKGDFNAARDLYTEGINIMGAFDPVKQSEKELMAHMHSNRGVTYFREKNFTECIDDCELAIKYDPHYDKSWVRLWRGYMAQGDFETAHDTLEKAAEKVPNSSRIGEELQRSRQEKVIMNSCRVFMGQEKFSKAKEVLDECCKNTTNLSLICLAVRASSQIGDTSSAFEYTNKALRLNPKNPEAMGLQGYCYFLTGETEKGAHILYDAYRLDEESVFIKGFLTQCQKTHAALSQARSAMKKGRYEEATTSFSAAIQASEPIPKAAPLYTMIRVERADGWLRNNKHLEALKDCQQIFSVQKEHAAAWVIRSEVLIALGKAGDAKKELEKIRKTWGADELIIEDGYKRADFEMRVKKEEDDLLTLVREMEAGISNRFYDIDVTNNNSSRRGSRRGSKSGRKHTGSVAASPVERKQRSIQADLLSPMTVGEDPLRSSQSSRNDGLKVRNKLEPSSPRKRDPAGRPSTSRRKPQPSLNDDTMSVGGRPRTRRASDDSMSVGGRPRRKSHDDSVSVGGARRKPRRELDDSVSVGGERRSRPNRDRDSSTRNERRTKSRLKERDSSVRTERRAKSRARDKDSSTRTERKSKPRMRGDESSRRSVRGVPKSPLRARRTLDDGSRRPSDKKRPGLGNKSVSERPSAGSKVVGERRPGLTKQNSERSMGSKMRRSKSSKRL